MIAHWMYRPYGATQYLIGAVMIQKAFGGWMPMFDDLPMLMWEDMVAQAKTASGIK
jgi:hypothetical protein